MTTIVSFQPELRPELPLVDGPKEYQEQRSLFIRLDELLDLSNVEHRFFELSAAQQEIDLSTLSAARLHAFKSSCSQAFRSNLARILTGLSHREFCIRLADSTLLQWFMRISRVDGVSCFSKSSSDRFAHFIDADSLQRLNAHLLSELAEDPAVKFNLKKSISFNEVFFDSTCLKSSTHHPTDWVLLVDSVRTLCKSITCIRKQGLRWRMPKDPSRFESEINSLAMAITSKNYTPEGQRQRKKIFRKMKNLLRCVVGHADRHLKLLLQGGQQAGLSKGQIRQIAIRMENVLGQIAQIIRQAHERIIGGRQLSNKDKILSLYDPDLQVIKRGKAGAEVEFGNNLWLGESSDGFIVDYLLERVKTSDSKQVIPASKRLIEEPSLPVTHVWGDRGLHSVQNEQALTQRGIYSGLCPRDIGTLQQRLKDDPKLRLGLKRRASIEGRISILVRQFMGVPPRAKGFKNRSSTLGWAVLTHNLWKLARLEQAEQKQAAA